jgi:hypothetical protein
MSFTQATFLGASIRGFTSSIGWNVGQPSQLSIALVEDPANGDLFAPVPVGTPIFFTVGSFNFFGLLQKHERRNDVNGLPVYDVVCVDPREILDGAQVVIAGYNGSVGSIPNLFNAYGWWEDAANGGFGGSLANDAGIPWTKVRDAVVAMANQPFVGTYGGPLNYRGVTYSLDLSEVPSPPIYYRVGGNNVSLLELIAQACEDGGCDFFVELRGFTIRVRTVSRATQPPLGTITALVNTNTGNVVRSSSGIEARHEVTSSFLVGGEVTTLYQSNSVQAFWGFDIVGNPIVSVDGTFDLKDAAGNISSSVATEFMNLNAQPVADIIGQTDYPCSLLEMRMAKCNLNTWSSFMIHQRKSMADRIGLTTLTTIKNMGANGNVRKQDMVNDERGNAIAQAKLALISDLFAKVTRMYEYVKGFADEAMGRRFLVPLPFILRNVDPETLRVESSYDVAEGGFLPDGSAPLGLSDLNQDIFRLQDGRFRCFVEFDNIQGADLSHVNPQGTAIEGNTLFMEAQVASQIVFNPGPYAIVALQSPVFEEASDFTGDKNLLAAAHQLAPAVFQDMVLKSQYGSLGIRVQPALRYPDAAAIPLKSNILQYGPWFAAGAAGKVKFDQDPTLTPWNYGGWDFMNLAGAARVNQAVTNMTISEAGQVELAGAPTVSLGDVLQTSGPNVTNIDVSYGTQGVTTTYRFQTFTPRYGVFNRNLGERLKRMGLISQGLGRSVRAAFKEQSLKQNAVLAANRTAKAFMENAPKQVKKESPYDVLVGYSEADPSGMTRIGLSAMTYEEAIPLSNADDDSAFQATGMMSFSGLLRPFCTAPGNGLLMPSYATPSVTGAIANVATLDPWKGYNDVEVYAWGNTYQGLHAQRRNATGANARPLALRGPVVISGWGFDWQGNAVPGPGSGAAWDADTLTRSDKWRVGPLDPLWDASRGVWTCHGTARGQTQSVIAASGSGSLKLYDPNGLTNELLTVWNWSRGTGISGSKDVIANYAPRENKWFITAVDC